MGSSRYSGCGLYVVLSSSGYSGFIDEDVNAVTKGFYVDDLVRLVRTVNELCSFANEVTILLGKAEFRLTKCMTNRREVLSEITDGERARPALNLDLEDLRVEKTLRVQRDVEKDPFLFKVRLPQQPPTKHGILSTVSSLYVPMEFDCPFVLEARKVLQKLRKLNLGLDDEISLYLFSDASEDGFGMCAYLRLVEL